VQMGLRRHKLSQKVWLELNKPTSSENIVAGAVWRPSVSISNENLRHKNINQHSVLSNGRFSL
jgi:hypothetical protein